MKLFFKSLGEGKSVVILHGLFGSSDNWLTFGRMLSEQGYKVILVDLANHGRSPHSLELNYQALVTGVKELFDDEKLQGSVVIGHSMGGKTAMEFAIQNPDYLSKLIVVDIAPRAYPLHHQQILETLNKVDFNQIKTRGEADSFVAKGIPQPDVRQFLLKNLYWEEGHKLAWRFNLKVITRDIDKVGAAIYPPKGFDLPTLFIKGEESNYITYEDEREIFDYFENVEVKTVENAGHWVHAENPKALLEIISTFINE